VSQSVPNRYKTLDITHYYLNFHSNPSSLSSPSLTPSPLQVYKNFIYMSAHAHSVDDTTVLQDGDQLVDLDAWFTVASYNDDVRHVIESHPWGCYGLHVWQQHGSPKVVNTALGIALNVVPRYETIRKEGDRIAPHYRHDDILLCAPTYYSSIFNARAGEHLNHFEREVRVKASSPTLLTPRAGGAMCGFVVVVAHHYLGLSAAFLAWLAGPILWIGLGDMHDVADQMGSDMHEVADQMVHYWTIGPPTIFVLKKLLAKLGFKFVSIGTASLCFIYGASSISRICQQKRSEREKQILEVLLQTSNATCQ
jgi:hypothetical protein